ncbi:hypothetical protein HDV63DRAFT_162761 [Trichoderma sp. SZMC 28014]
MTSQALICISLHMKLFNIGLVNRIYAIERTSCALLHQLQGTASSKLPRRETWPPYEKYATHAIRLSDWTEASEVEVPINGAKPCRLIAVGLAQAEAFLQDRGLWRKATLLMARILNVKKKRYIRKSERSQTT